MITFERYFHNSRLEYFEKLRFKGMFLANIPSSLKNKVHELFSEELIIRESEDKIEIPFIVPTGKESFPKKGIFVISKEFKSLTEDNKHYYFLEDAISVSSQYLIPERKSILENNTIFSVLDQKFIFRCSNRKIGLENILN